MHKHLWVRVTTTKTLVQCVDCGKIAKQRKHKHVFGPWRERYPNMRDGGGFQMRSCTVEGCDYQDITKIDSKWYPLSWKIHLHR